MKCKEFLKIANNFRDGFMAGVRKALRIHSPSNNAPEPGTCIDIGTAIGLTEQATKEAYPEMAEPASYDDFIQAAMSCGEIGERARYLIKALGEFGESMSLQRFAREQTNNWRKMHGLPMRRSTMQERRSKIAK